MTLPVVAVLISVAALIVAAWSATVATLARRDAKEARRAADAAAAPQLTLTFDPRRRILVLRNLGSRPAHKVEVEVTDLKTSRRQFQATRASLSPAPNGQTELISDLTADDIHGSRARLAWLDHSGRKFVRNMVGNRAAPDGYEFPEAAE